MSEQTPPPEPPKEEPAAPPAEPPKVEPDPPKAEPPTNYQTQLDKLEADMMVKLGDTIAIEDYADLTQKQRIKVFRDMSKLLPKPTEPPKADPIKKGTSKDPTKQQPNPGFTFKTLAEKNNLRDFQKDIRKRGSHMSQADKIRNGTFYT